MSQYIVVSSGGEVWLDLDDCWIYQVTPKQMELLENGDSPKWLTRCKRIDAADINIDKLGLCWVDSESPCYEREAK